jgi:c-di-GMP-binding flagellar brake protein YcgR
VTEFTSVRAQRVATAIVATVSAGKRAAVRFTILNISVTGAKLEGPLALKLHQRISIRFQSDATCVELEAEVVRVDTPDLMVDQIAVRFIDPSSDARDAIGEIVKRAVDAADQPDPGQTDKLPIIG